MAEYTENLNLKKPAQDEQYNVDDFNDNFDKIDDFAGIVPPRALTADKLTTGAKINGVNFKGDTDIITGLGLYSDTNTYNNTNLVYLYDNGKLKIFQSTQNGNIGHNPLNSPIYWTEIQIGSKRHYGESITSSLPIIDDDTLHLADGSLLSQQDYPELLSYIANLYNSLPSGEFSQATQLLGNHEWNAIAYGNGLFVAVGYDGKFTTYSDGAWTTPSTMVEGITGQVGIAYGNGKFVCITEDGKVITSQNGLEWTALSGNPLGITYWVNITYGDGKFVALERSEGKIKYSSDGETWSDYILLAVDESYGGICYDGTKFLALSADGYINISYNLTTWTMGATGFEGDYHDWSDLIYTGVEYIAISQSGRVSTSKTGNANSWSTPTINTNLGDNSWTNIAYGNSKVVAIGYNGYVSIKGVPFTNVFTTEADWQTSYTTYGECGKYVYNSTNNTVRIPLYSTYFTNTVNPQNLGNLTPASIPNIKGFIPASEKLYKSGTSVSDYGAFRDYAENVVSGQSDNTHFDNDLWDFDASRSNAIYSDTATTVNTQSIKQLVYIVVKA